MKTKGLLVFVMLALVLVVGALPVVAQDVTCDYDTIEETFLGGTDAISELVRLHTTGEFSADIIMVGLDMLDAEVFLPLATACGVPDTQDVVPAPDCAATTVNAILTDGKELLQALAVQHAAGMIDDEELLGSVSIEQARWRGLMMACGHDPHALMEGVPDILTGEITVTEAAPDADDVAAGMPLEMLEAPANLLANAGRFRTDADDIGFRVPDEWTIMNMGNEAFITSPDEDGIILAMEPQLTPPPSGTMFVRMMVVTYQPDVTLPDMMGIASDYIQRIVPDATYEGPSYYVANGWKAAINPFTSSSMSGADVVIVLDEEGRRGVRMWAIAAPNEYANLEPYLHLMLGTMQSPSGTDGTVMASAGNAQPAPTTAPAQPAPTSAPAQPAPTTAPAQPASGGNVTLTIHDSQFGLYLLDVPSAMGAGNTLQVSNITVPVLGVTADTYYKVEYQGQIWWFEATYGLNGRGTLNGDVASIPLVSN